jgi:outer membrane lipoprotein-sorting protein
MVTILIQTILAVCIFGVGTDFESLRSAFVENQGKIKTFIGTGNIRITITNEKGSTIKQTEAPLTLFVRLPDDFRIDIGGQQPMSMIQKKKFISQRIETKSVVVTEQVTTKTDLAKNYFMRSLDELNGPVTIIGSDSFTDNGMTFHKFTIEPPSINDSKGLGYKIDRIELVFDAHAMLVRYSLYANGREVIRVSTEYMKKGDIFAPSVLTVVTNQNGMSVRNIMSYTGITLNSRIADKDFEFK